MNVLKIALLASLGSAYFMNGFVKTHWDKYNTGAARKVLERMFYSVETLDFHAENNTANISRMAELEKNESKFEDYLARKDINEDDREWYLTGVATGVIIGTEKDGSAINEARKRAKRPVPTRIGQLLKEQHAQWEKYDADFQKIKAQSPEYYELICSVDKRTALTAQALAILGFIDFKGNPEAGVFLADFMARTELFNKYFVKGRMMMPNLDRIITFLLNDPAWQGKRKDDWSTLHGFKAAAYRLSEHDKLVQKIVKLYNIDYDPKNLFIKK